MHKNYILKSGYNQPFIKMSIQYHPTLVSSWPRFKTMILF